jgi:WS/DGAT/MGAT family acyltransferase
MDGVAAMATLPATFDFMPGPVDCPEKPPAEEPYQREPGTMQLLTVAVDDFVRQDIRLVRSLPRLAGAIVKVGRRAASTLQLLPKGMKLAPRTRLNVPIASDRIYCTLTLPLTEAKLLGKSRHATINDIVMAVCAGGLRRYLAGHKALPAESLTAAVPVSLRGAGQTEENNQSGVILCDLATNLADPLERLAAIAVSSRDSRNRFLDIQDIFPTEFSVPGAPLVMTGIARVAWHTRLLDLLPPLLNVLISNVPGPRQPMYCAGVAAEHHFPISIPFHRCALNITVLSYRDNIEFGLVACRATVPDLQHIADHIAAEFADLKRAAAMLASDGAIETLELEQIHG